MRHVPTSRREQAATDYVLDLLVSHVAVTLTYDECARSTPRCTETLTPPSAGSWTATTRWSAKADAVVVVGNDDTDVGAPTEFSFYARVAANLETP